MSNIDFNLLKVFVVAYREKNLNRTARLLNYTAPAISIKLSKLKEKLRGELFIKVPTGVEPTPLADELYRKVAPLIAELEHSVTDLGHFDPALITGKLRIDLGQHFQPWLCPRVFKNIRQHNDDVEINFEHFSPQSIERLRNDETDICVQYVSRSKLAKDIVEIPAGHDHMAMLASASHPHKAPSGQLSELLNYGLAMLQPGLPEDAIGPLMDTIKTLKLPLNISCTAPSIDCITDIIEGSDLLTPCSVRATHHYGSRLKYIEVEGFPELSHHGVAIYIHQRNRHSELHKWLVEMIKEQFAR